MRLGELHRSPTGVWRAALLASYGIPIESWDALASMATVETFSREALVVPSQAPTSPSPSTVPTGSLAEVNAHLSRLRSDLETLKLTSAERSRLSDVYTRALAVKARLEREAEMLEDRIVRDHPAWRRLKAAMFEALHPYPDALRALLKSVGADA